MTRQQLHKVTVLRHDDGHVWSPATPGGISTHLWGEPKLKPYVAVVVEEAVAASDERLEQVARRFLR